MVKLTRDTGPDGAAVVRVEGWLQGQGIDDLRGMCDRDAPGVIDLSGLRSADVAGWELLKSLKRSGWTVAGASLFVAGVLQEARS